jgi:hypothetical protein
MSAEVAEAEDCPLPPGVGQKKSRKPEIRLLSKKLDALQVLDNLSYAALAVESFVRPKNKPSHYLLKYDNEQKTVSVEFFNSPLGAAASYDDLEKSDNLMDQNTANIVLVEVDKLDNIREAYPNYFGDVQIFKTALKRIVQGKGLEEYLLKPQEKAMVPARTDVGDYRWLKRRGRWE